MREFSPHEQAIIKDKLINGAVFTKLFSDNFLTNTKFEIEIDRSENGFSRFQFVSETYSPEQGSKELVNMVNLLQFLLLNGLVYKYPPIGFNLSDYDAEPSFTLGNETLSPGKGNVNIRRTLLSGFPKEITDFINTYWYYQFEATEPLKSLAHHDFKSLEERMHNESVSQQKVANRITLVIALATIVFTYYQNKVSYDDLNFKVGELTEKFRQQSDKIPLIQKSFKIQTDSIKTKLNKLSHEKIDKQNRLEKTK